MVVLEPTKIPGAAIIQRTAVRRLKVMLRWLRDACLMVLDLLIFLVIRKHKNSEESDHTRVVIFNMHGAGDLILSLPCLERLRQAFPASRYSLTLVCSPSNLELATLYAPVDHLLSADRHRLLRSISYRVAVIKMLAAQGFAVAINPTFNRISAVEDSMLRATGASEIIGSGGSPMFANRPSRWLGQHWYSRLIVPSPGTMHELDRYAEFLDGLGLPLSAVYLPALSAPLPPPPIDLSEYILIVPDSSSHLKSWPMEKFEELAHNLVDHINTPIVFAGAPGAKRPGDDFVRWHEGRYLDLTGQTGIQDFLSLIANARLIICNDSSSLHFAVTLGRPVVAVAGGGLPQRYHPYPVSTDPALLRIVENRLPCYGCNWECVFPIQPGSPCHCINTVDVDKVLDAVLDLDREITKMLNIKLN